MILNIIERKKKLIKNALLEAQSKIQGIVDREFTDFDKVIVGDNADDIVFYKDSRWIRFNFYSSVYDNGSHVRKTRYQQGSWSKKELVDISKRLNSLFE